MKNEKCYICCLAKTNKTFFFWKKDFKGYTDDFKKVGKYKISKVTKNYDYPIVRYKVELSIQMANNVRNIIIPEKNIWDLFEKPKRRILR